MVTKIAKSVHATVNFSIETVFSAPFTDMIVLVYLDFDDMPGFQAKSNL